MKKLKFGVLAPQGWFLDLPKDRSGHDQYNYSIETVKEAERLGYDSAWFVDHFNPLPGTPPTTVFEAWTLLSAVAAVTNEIGLGTMVSCNSYRHPSLLAKMAATVDVMSNGRMIFGIGAGWYEEEYLAYGYPFPKPSVRIGMLTEGVQIIRKMWTEERASFSGKYYAIRDLACDPKPVQKPYPPILVGGGGEQLTLKVVARYGDACNVFGGLGEEVLRKKLEALRRHCSVVGRNYQDIEKTCRINFAFTGEGKDAETIQAEIRSTGRIMSPGEAIIGDPKLCVEKLKELMDMDFTHFIIQFPHLLNKSLRIFAEEIIPILV